MAERKLILKKKKKEWGRKRSQKPHVHLANKSSSFPSKAVWPLWLQALGQVYSARWEFPPVEQAQTQSEIS